MADNYLITGYWGEPHVTTENDRGINAAMFGTGRFVLPVGEQFRAEYIGNNTIRMYDGKLMDNGAAAGIPVGTYIDLLVPEAGQGKKRNDLIVFQYAQDASTLIESGTFVVVKGTETSGTASDPGLTQADLLSGEATFDQMALWRVSVSGTTIGAPVKLFSVYQNNVSHAADKNNPHGVTVAQIGAAPAGFGLGETAYHLTPVTDANTAVLSGWYLLESDATNGIGSARAVMRVDAYNSNSLLQTAFTTHYSNKYHEIRQRACINGNWSEWEQVNPSMELGILYRTTEKYKGKPVYAKLIDFGALPNTTVKTVGFYSTEVTAVVYVGGMLSDGCYIGAGYNRDRSRATSAGLYLDNTLTNVRIYTEHDMSAVTAYVLVKFTRD